MCLIITREKNVILPKEDFITAVDNNPDGWGLSVPDGDGLLYTMKSCPEDGTDAEALYDLLHDEFAKEKFLLHLRYTTAGETSLRNAHPFPVLEKSKHGIDMRMAHNGTLQKYKPGSNDKNSWESDTRVFTRTYVRPLVQRMAMAIGAENVSEDLFTHDLLYDQLTSMSVLVFIDGNGEFMYVNELGNGGFFDKETGTYYSNKYSFDQWHRVGTSGRSYNTGYGSHRSPGSDYYDGWSQVGANQTSTPKKKRTKQAMSDVNQPKFSEVFSEEYGIDGLEDMLSITDETINVLLKDGEATEAFIKEMLCNAYEMYQVVNQVKSKEKKLNEQLAQAQGKLHDAHKRIESQNAWIVRAKSEGYDDKAA